MGLSIRCILERDVPGLPFMEGKSLLAAFCADDGEVSDFETASSPNVIAVDFGGGKSTTAPNPSSSIEPSLFGSLAAFIAGDGAPQWHAPADGLEVVRIILKKLREGATVTISPDFEFAEDDPEELTAGALYDLEAMEQILFAAERAGTRFRLDLS